MAERRTLNVGCGKETYGTDFIDLYPSRAEVKKVDLDNQKLPYADNSFDEVYSKCVLEHMRNVGFVLSEMVRVLKPRGKLTVITDNANCIQYALWKSEHGGGYEAASSKAGKFEDRHYSLFTGWHLRNHFRKLGIKAENITISYEDIEQIKGATLKTTVLRKLLYALMKLFLLTPFWRASYHRLRVLAQK
jgi:SAM-dependent methyltransferase